MFSSFELWTGSHLYFIRLPIPIIEGALHLNLWGQKNTRFLREVNDENAVQNESYPEGRNEISRTVRSCQISQSVENNSIILGYKTTGRYFLRKMHTLRTALNPQTIIGVRISHFIECTKKGLKSLSNFRKTISLRHSILSVHLKRVRCFPFSFSKRQCSTYGGILIFRIFPIYQNDFKRPTYHSSSLGSCKKL